MAKESKTIKLCKKGLNISNLADKIQEKIEDHETGVINIRFSWKHTCTKLFGIPKERIPNGKNKSQLKWIKYVIERSRITRALNEHWRRTKKALYFPPPWYDKKTKDRGTILTKDKEAIDKLALYEAEKAEKGLKLSEKRLLSCSEIQTLSENIRQGARDTAQAFNFLGCTASALQKGLRMQNASSKNQEHINRILEKGERKKLT